VLKLELRRYLFSKSTLVFLLGVTVISALSWGSSLYEQSLILEQNLRFADAPEGDSLYIVYNGWTFLYNLWFNNAGSSAFTIYFVYAWLGVVLTSRLHAERANRFGNLIITRQSYKQRFHNISLAQSIYITILIGVYILISVIVSLLLGGPTHTSNVGIAAYNWIAWVGISVLQFLWLSISFVVINFFCLLLNMWIKQKQLLQILPFVFFFIVPTFLWTLTVQTSPALFRIVSGFNNTEMTMNAFGFLFQDWGFGHFLRSAQTVVTTIAFIIILYPLHLRKGNDYL